MRLYMYLDESGPFQDRDRGNAWPMSVVAGVMSEHPLDNNTMRPVLDRIESYGNFGLRDRDLHAMELRDRLGPDYADWMRNALLALHEVDSSVRVICFRSSEKLSGDDRDATYMTVLVEGFVRVIPLLIERYGRDLDRITVVIENRRRMDGGGHVHRGDSAVERNYVSLEDYASRLRTRLRLELIRHGMEDSLQIVSQLQIQISDPSTDKALNFADFVAHQCRYRDRTEDRGIYESALAPIVAFDVPLVMHQGYDAAQRQIEEGRLGAALLSYAEVMTETQSNDVKRRALEGANEVFKRLRKLGPHSLTREMEEYLEAVEERVLYGQHLQEESTDLTLGAADPQVREQLDEFLTLFDRLCRQELEREESSRGPRDGLRGEQARVIAWRWGLLRAQQERLRLANRTGDMDVAEEAIRTARPLLGRFGRSFLHLPRVLQFLRDVSRADAHMLRLQSALDRIDRIARFLAETEQWWGLGLPDILPGISEPIDPTDVLSEPLGFARLERARVRLRYAELLDPTTSGMEQQALRRQAIDDMTEAMSEFSYPVDRMMVAGNLSRAQATVGLIEEAITTLIAPTGIRAEAIIEAIERGSANLVQNMLRPLTHAPEPARAVRAFLDVFAAAVREGGPGAEHPLSEGIRSALTMDTLQTIASIARRTPATSILDAIHLAGAIGNLYLACGHSDAAHDAFRRAAAMRPRTPTLTLAIDIPLLEMQLAALFSDKSRNAGEVQAATEMLARVRDQAVFRGSDPLALDWIRRVEEQLSS